MSIFIHGALHLATRPDTPPAPGGAPTAPANVSATITGVTVSGDFITTSDDETGFTVEVSIDGGAWGAFDTPAAVNQTGAPVSFGGTVAEDASVRFRATATNGFGSSTSAPSGTLVSRPAAPTTLALNGTIGASSVPLSATNPGDVASQIQLKRKVTSGGAYSVVRSFNAPATGSIDVSDDNAPVATSELFYKLTAVNAAGGSADSNEAGPFSTVQTDTPPAAPTMNVLTNVTSSSVDASCTTVSGVQGYLWLKRLAGTQTWSVDIQTVGTTHSYTGLLSATGYEFAVQSVKTGTGTLSAVSNVRSQTTDTAGGGGVTPDWDVDFESGYGPYAGGNFNGGGSNNVFVGPGGFPDTVNGNALQLIHRAKPITGTTATEDSSAEQRFTLTTGITDLYLRFKIFIPSNYYHRGQFSGCQQQNNKYLALWEENYSGLDGLGRPAAQLILETRPMGDQGGVQGWSYLTIKGNRHNSPTNVTLTPNVLNFITTAEIGQWNDFLIHCALASTPGATDGVLEIFWNGVLRSSKYDQILPAVSDGHYFRKGYFNGAANTGYSEDTNFRIDELQVYSENPL